MTALRRVAALISLGCALALSLVLFTARPALAQADGLVASTTKTYTPDPDSSEIKVVATYTLTNVTADQSVDEFSVRSFFFRSWGVTVPTNATDLAAFGSGRSLRIELEPSPETEAISFAIVSLPFDLQYQQTVNLEVSYTIPGSAPRGEALASRANGSYLSFPIWVRADEGRATLRVDVPDGFDIEFQGSEGLELRTEGDRTFYEVVDIEDPVDFFVRAFGRNDDGLLAIPAEIDNATATVRAWPDDPEWADFVVDAFEDDVPVMEDLIGYDWPAGDIEVIESVTPYLRGYGGWFNRSSGEIEVGDVLDREIILHEFAHGWFNQSLISGRWIAEGLADEFASQTISASGAARPEPERPSLGSPVRVQLNEWAAPFTLGRDEQVEYESYHYNAAWWVIHEITDEVGVEAMSDVLVAVDDRTSAFSVGVDRATDLNVVDWKQFLDLVERGAGSTRAQELFDVHVLTDPQSGVLDDRADAHVAYDEFLDESALWDAPLAVRTAMARWQFDLAERRIDKAGDVLAIRDSVTEMASELGVSFVNSPAEHRYESATNDRHLENAAALANERLATLVELADARVALVAQADELGVQVSFAESGYRSAVDQVDQLDRQLVNLAAARESAEAEVEAAGLVMPAWPESSVDVDFEAEADLIEERLDTVQVIDAAAGQVGESRSLLQKLGLWRSDPDADIAAARVAFEADDREAALAASAAADATIADAADVGRSRGIWAVVITVVSVAVVTAFVVGIRRRKRRPASA